MAKRPPKSIAIDHDDYHAQYVGHTKDGRQFFMTPPFVPAIGANPGREFIALYIFDKAGNLESATIDDLGPRPIGPLPGNTAPSVPGRDARRDEFLASLGEVAFRRIKIAPFKVERFGIEFGLIPQPPEEEGEDWSVIAEPGNYMCFWPPWSGGDYDT